MQNSFARILSQQNYTSGGTAMHLGKDEKKNEVKKEIKISEKVREFYDKGY